jgi:hypothetical protein
MSEAMKTEPVPGAHPGRGDDRLDLGALDDSPQRAGDVMDHHVCRLVYD